MKKQCKSSIIKNHKITKQNFSDGVPLTVSKTTNFRLFQTESLCRRQFHI